MLRTLIGAAALSVVLTGAAHAQLGNTGNTGNTASDNMKMNMLPGDRHLTPEEQQREREIEARYNETVRDMPDKKGAKDPWGNLRPSGAPATAANKTQKK